MSEYIYDINPEMVFDFVSLEGFSNAFLKNAKEEIVRCRDCKHMEENEYCICMLPDGFGGHAYWFVNPKGFCAWGERKDENGR